MYGFDADMTLRTDGPFSFGATVSYLHARYKSYPNAVINVPIGGPTCLCGNMTAVRDLSGFRLPDAPEWTFGLNGNYTQDFSFGTINLAAQLYRTEEYALESSSRIIQSAYTTLNLRGELQPAGSNFTVYVWGKNVTNTHYLAAGFIAATGDGGVYGAPATYGVGAKYSF
jgi:iron complex outermembrane receptor protein